MAREEDVDFRFRVKPLSSPELDRIVAHLRALNPRWSIWHDGDGIICQHPESWKKIREIESAEPD